MPLHSVVAALSLCVGVLLGSYFLPYGFHDPVPPSHGQVCLTVNGGADLSLLRMEWNDLDPETPPASFCFGETCTERDTALVHVRDFTIVPEREEAE